MTAKQYLSQTRDIKIRLDAMKEQAEFLRSVAQYSGVQYSDMPKAPRNIKSNEDAYIRLLEKEERIKELERKLTEIESNVSKVNDAVLQSILSKRYLSGKQWSDIASELHISTSRIYELHRVALVEMEGLLKKHSKP